MRIKYTTSLAVAAGLLAMAVGAARIHAAITVASTDVPKGTTGPPVTSTLNFTVNGTITDADITNFNNATTWSGDLELSLTRPGGAAVLIFGDCGGSDDNFVNVSISDEGVAPTCAANGNTPHTGPLRGAPNGVPSATVMTAFDGAASMGIWTLTIEDDFPGGDPQNVTSWSLTLDGPPPLPAELMKLEVE